MSAYASQRDASRTSVIMPVAIALFSTGMIATVTIFLLYAFGYTELPLWLSLSAIGCTSVGFALGFVALLREARSG